MPMRSGEGHSCISLGDWRGRVGACGEEIQNFDFDQTLDLSVISLMTHATCHTARHYARHQPQYCTHHGTWYQGRTACTRPLSLSALTIHSTSTCTHNTLLYRGCFDAAATACPSIYVHTYINARAVIVLYTGSHRN